MFLFMPQNYECSLNEATFAAEELSKIELDIELKIASGSLGLNMYSKQTALFDNIYIAKIKIPDVSKENLLKEIQNKENTNDFRKYSIKETHWWKVADETICIQRSYTNANGGHVELFLCRENEIWVLYICCAYG